MTEPAPRRRKRSQRAALTTLTAIGVAALSACGSGSEEETKLSEQQYGAGVDAFPYDSAAECKADDKVPDEECDKAELAAREQNELGAPRFEAQDQCEDQFGAGRCVQQFGGSGGYSGSSGSFFTPLLTGFVVGQMLGGGGPRYRYSGLYRDERDGVSYVGGGAGGGWVYRDYRSGGYKVGGRAFDPPVATPRVQTRSSVVSRGGFGGRSSFSARSSGGGSRGGWGG